MTTAKFAVSSAFVMSCTREQLVALALFAGMTAGKIEHAVKRDASLKKLRATVGTKLANDPATRDALAAGTLEVELPVSPSTEQQPPHGEQQQQTSGASQSSKRAATKSAKDWLRELLSQPGASYTIAQLVALTGKSEVNIRTMLSDLRSPKYAGKRGVFNTKSVRVNGQTFYSMA